MSGTASSAPLFFSCHVQQTIAVELHVFLVFAWETPARLTAFVARHAPGHHKRACLFSHGGVDRNPLF